MSTTPEIDSGSCKLAPACPHRRLQLSRPLVLVLLTLSLVFFALIRYRLRTMPLERDEGEYAYSGQLLLDGIPPYQLAYNMKLPGIYAAYAGIMKMLGETAAGIHVGLLMVNAATIIVLYFLAARLFGTLAGITAACTYGALSTSASVMGFEAHATNFVVLPALIGIVLLLRALQCGNAWTLLASGLFTGTAVLMKQHGAFFVLFGVLYLLIADCQDAAPRRQFVRRVAIYTAGVVIPYAITCALLYKAGVFHQFWFWTVSYAGEYSKMGLRRAIRAFLENSAIVVGPAIPLWILAAIGFSAIWWSASAGRHSRFLVVLFICSFLSLCPGAFFRPHYFVLILPITAILVGTAVACATESGTFARKWQAIPIAVFILCVAWTILTQRKDYFVRDPQTVLQSIYPDDPFVAAVTVADYVKANSSPADRIAVLGSEPEIYFYSQRHSATGYIYMYSLIVRHKYTVQMRDQFMRELEMNRPRYLIYADVWNSWGERTGSAQAAPFLGWLQQYMNSEYEQVGVADLGPATNYVWGNAAATYRPSSSKAIHILLRKSSTEAQSIQPDALRSSTVIRFSAERTF